MCFGYFMLHFSIIINLSLNLQSRNLFGTKINLPQRILQSRNSFRY